MFVVTLTDNFQYQSQFLDIDNISLWDQKKNIQQIELKYCGKGL